MYLIKGTFLSHLKGGASSAYCLVIVDIADYVVNHEEDSEKIEDSGEDIVSEAPENPVSLLDHVGQKASYAATVISIETDKKTGKKYLNLENISDEAGNVIDKLSVQAPRTLDKLNLKPEYVIEFVAILKHHDVNDGNKWSMIYVQQVKILRKAD